MDINLAGLRRAFAKIASQIGLERLIDGRSGTPVIANVCITMVKNEQDIIEPFLRHNAKFFDAMIVLDNGSQDQTRAIAEALGKELGIIFVTDFLDHAFNQ